MIISCTSTKIIIPKNSVNDYTGDLYFSSYDSNKYPRDTINRGPNDSLSTFTNKWYSQHLNSLNEPIIFDKKDKNLQIIRFTNLGTWDHPYTYRVEKFADKINVTYRQTDGLGGYQTGKLIKNYTKKVNNKKWNHLISKLDEVDFWNIQTQDPNRISDGAEWILEVLINGKYHLVTRNSPDVYNGKKYAELCELITKM